MAGYPKDYEKPEEKKDFKSDYMKISKEGDRKIRILRSPIIGFETWENVTGDDGKTRSKPNRARTFQEAVNLPSKDGKVKEFHAFVVWDYETETIKLLTVTQKYRLEIYDYSIREEWGDLSGYDFVINRKGLTFEDTEYSIRPMPHKPMSKDIKDAYKEVTIKEELYFEGGHPIVREDSLADDVANALGEDKPKTNYENDMEDGIDISEDVPF